MTQETRETCGVCGRPGTRTRPLGVVHILGLGMAHGVHETCGDQALREAARVIGS